MKVVDLFAGCGGLSLGFQNAESEGKTFDIVAAYDAWGIAVQNYANNFQHPICEMDLHDVDAAAQHISRFAPDIIIGVRLARTSLTLVSATSATMPA